MSADVFTPVLRALARERDELERHIARHKGLGPEYNRAAHVRCGEIDRIEERLYAARREAEARGGA